jgi:hypothetical protein
MNWILKYLVKRTDRLTPPWWNYLLFVEKYQNN